MRRATGSDSDYWPSAANFVMIRVGDAAPVFVATLAAHGVHVRDKLTGSGHAGLHPRHRRACPNTPTRRSLPSKPQSYGARTDATEHARRRSIAAPPRHRSRASWLSTGAGKYDVRTGIRFFDHMLELFTRHGGFDLTLHATGDLDVDQHHTVEDVGIVLGEAVSQRTGDRKGINRAGYFVMPMDETLAVVAIDLSGQAARRGRSQGARAAGR